VVGLVQESEEHSKIWKRLCTTNQKKNILRPKGHYKSGAKKWYSDNNNLNVMQ
jgi:hypothetical protein